MWLLTSWKRDEVLLLDLLDIGLVEEDVITVDNEWIPTHDTVSSACVCLVRLLGASACCFCLTASACNLGDVMNRVKVIVLLPAVGVIVLLTVVAAIVWLIVVAVIVLLTAVAVIVLLTVVAVIVWLTAMAVIVLLTVVLVGLTVLEA